MFNNENDKNSINDINDINAENQTSNDSPVYKKLDNDSSVNESLPNDSSVNEALSNDSSVNESLPNDSSVDESFPNDSSLNENVPYESSANENLPVDSIEYDNSANCHSEHETINNASEHNNTDYFNFNVHANTEPQYCGSNSNNQYVNANMNNYYKEHYKKTKEKSNTWKYILVSGLSSIVGGAIVAGMLLFLPIIPSNDESGNKNIGIGELKKVEIVASGEEAVSIVAEKVGPSVVGIRTTYQSSSNIFGVQSSDGEGSGIIISSDGLIITNHHVIEKALDDKTREIRSGAKVEVFLPNKMDRPYSATVKGYDAKTDLAVLSINENNLPAIEFGDSDKLKVGEQVVAIGNPGGLEYMGSVTGGYVSGLNRTVQVDTGRKIKLIQTDAAINPGNSGGALVNLKGELIGINTIKMVQTGFEGVGIAIPVNEIKKISEELIKNNYISRPYLGIMVNQNYTEDIAKKNNMPMGIFVADVELLGAAQKAGIKANDVIVSFNNKAVKSFDELEEEKNKFKPGDVVEAEIYRDGKTIKVSITLGETK